MFGIKLRGKPAMLIATVAAVLTIGLGAGVAHALTTTATGSTSDRQYFTTNDLPYTVPAATPAGSWVNVPGMVRFVIVPAGETRLIDARFTAESVCDGGAWCSVRIVYGPVGGVPTELYPQSGLDYAFDSPAVDRGEGHALERNSRTFLAAGTYQVQVQAAKVGAVTTHRLDDMHLAIELVRP